MSDTLKARVGRVIAGSMHALLDRIEDQAPEAMMEQSIREADAVIDDVRHELGVVSANRHLSQQHHASLNSQHAKLAAQIDDALVGGREDLARAGVARQLDIEAQLPVLEATLGEAESSKLAWRPSLMTSVEDVAVATTLMKLIDALEDDDDVQTVWGNYDISDDVMERLG